MLGNRLWPRRKSLSDKKKTSIKTHINLDDQNIQYKKKKKSKIFDINTRFLSKLRSSFVKAKSFDQSQSSTKKENLNTKSSNEILDSKSQQKLLKSSKLSLRRIFASRRSKSMSISSSLDINNKEIGNISTSSRISSLTTLENDLKTNRSINPTNNNKNSQNNCISYYGIVNHGNTCYINSILQCLNSIDSFAKYFVLNKFKDDLSRLNKSYNSELNSNRKETISFLFSFALFLKSLWMSNLKCETISSDFKAKLAKVNRNFHTNDQQDAQEFLLFILNYCHETLKIPYENADKKFMTQIRERKYNINLEAKKIADQNCSKIHQLFATYQQLTITCPGCNTRQYKLEPHLCLSLPVPTKSMEPLYYCFVEKDGSQICAAMWINTVSLVQYVRANIAHKFRLDVKNVLIMVVTEAGFGKCYQDNESALELVLSDAEIQTPTNNLWSGIVAIEIASVNNNSSYQEYDSRISQPYVPHQQISIKQLKNTTQSIHRPPVSRNGDSRRQSGVYDNLSADEQNSRIDSPKPWNEESSPERQHSRTQKIPIPSYSSPLNSSKFSNENNSSDNVNTSCSPVNLVVIHVEEIIENSFVSGWRRFSAPVALLVHKEIEFLDLEKLILSQLETVYHCNIQSKLKLHLRFWVWDGLNNTDLEITNDHQFPLLTESVESIISWSENCNTIRIVAVWSPNNASRLLQTIYANLRLSHSLGRDISKMNMYNSKFRSKSLTLIDAWSTIEENGSVELVTRASLTRRPEHSESRNISLEDCLKAYLSEEVLDAKDAWKCPNCHTFQRATMSTSIYSLPEVLILHLKRFQSYSSITNFSHGKSFRDYEDIALSTVGGNDSHNNTGLSLYENNSNNKLNILVDYPLSGLDMKTYLSNNIELEIKKNSTKQSNNSDYFYDLIAVCNHQGTLSTGHYTAFCRSPVDYKWRLFNDEIVRELTADKVIQPNAYILYYQRRSTIFSHDQHWSSELELLRNSVESHTIQPQLKCEPNERVNNVNNNFSHLQRKSDPPKRRLPYQTKRISEIKTKDANYVLQHSNLRGPLPLDRNCNSLSNNTPILHDEDENENDSESSTNSSTSNENFIPTSVTTRPLQFRNRSTDHSSKIIPQTRI